MIGSCPRRIRWKVWGVRALSPEYDGWSGISESVTVISRRELPVAGLRGEVREDIVFVESANPLAWALTGLMNVPADERAAGESGFAVARGSRSECFEGLPPLAG